MTAAEVKLFGKWSFEDVEVRRGAWGLGEGVRCWGSCWPAARAPRMLLGIARPASGGPGSGPSRAAGGWQAAAGPREAAAPCSAAAAAGGAARAAGPAARLGVQLQGVPHARSIARAPLRQPAGSTAPRRCRCRRLPRPAALLRLR